MLQLSDPRRRLRAACVALAVLLSLFVGRLLQVQAVEAPAYAARAEAGRLRTVELPAVRGEITDINGTVLATSVAADNVTVDQTLRQGPGQRRDGAGPAAPVDAATLVQKLTGTKRFVYVAKQISPQTWKTRSRPSTCPGIFREATTKRVYPAGDLAANVVGFVGADGAGLGGHRARPTSRCWPGADGSATYEAGAGAGEIPTASVGVQRDAVAGHGRAD